MSDPNEQNQENVANFKDNNKPEKSLLDKGADTAKNVKDAKDTYDNVKKLAEAAKGIEALAPLVTAIGYIALALVIIFLVIGFVAFFITMPGLFANKFVQACKDFWNTIIIGNEKIEIKEENLVNLANYIEDLGYDIEGYGFATKSSITRETVDDDNKTTGKRGKITGINLDKSENTNESYVSVINMLTYAVSDSVKLEKENINNQPRLIYPVGVLSSTNIISMTKDGVDNYYKAVNSSKSDIGFFDKNGDPIRYEIQIKDGIPEFTRTTDTSKGYTYNDLINGVNINGYMCKVDGISYNDYVNLHNNNKLTNSITLKNQEQYIDEFILFLSQYEESTYGNDERNIRATLPIIRNLMGINSIGTIKKTAEEAISIAAKEGITPGAYIVKKIIESNKDNNNFTDDNDLFKFVKDASTSLKNLDTSMIESAALKNQNILAYILANERTYTAQGTEPNVGQRLLGWIPGVKNLMAATDVQRIEKLITPQYFGMIVFPDNAFSSQASAEKGDFEVTINREDNSMTISTSVNTGFLQWRTDQMKWNLSGWTSRYGKPIELSLALHLSTMAPDFVYDFCMDKELQTKVTIQTKGVTYKLDYSYITSNGKTIYKNDKTDDNGNVTEKGVVSLGDELMDKQLMLNGDKYLFQKDVYLGKCILNTTQTAAVDYANVPQDFMKQTYADDKNQYYPVDIFTGTNIISVRTKEETEYVYRYYKAVDKDGKPISIFDKNTKQIIPYTTIMKSDGTPYFVRSSDSRSDFSEIIGQSGDVIDGKKLTYNGEEIVLFLNVMSIQDLKILFEKIHSYNDGETIIKDTFKGNYQPKEKQTGYNNKVKDGNVFYFASYERYEKTWDMFWDLIGNIIKKEDNVSKENPDKNGGYLSQCLYYGIDFKLKLEKLHFANDNSKTVTYACPEYTFNSMKIKEELTEEEKSYYSNNSAGWRTISIKSEDYNSLIYNIEALTKAINKVVEQIEGKDDKYLHAKIYVLLSSNIRDTLDEYGMNISEFFALYDIFKDGNLKEEVSTYQPYIESVTNHWYKDLKFKIGSTYEESSVTKTMTYEFEPEENTTYYEKVKSLKEYGGKIMADMKPKDGQKTIVQKGQPEIIRNEPWHYKVKNWLVNGYYFIYDGTIQTSQEIDKAKLLLITRGYDYKNPLLIDLNDDEYDDLYSNGTRKSEIDNKAKEYNEILKNAGINVRLQKINFEKKSSLAAFSILESMHTEDSEYIYRDLKEYLIELGYFTRADFESIETSVLKWLIPSYTVYKDEWPDTEFEKNATEYGNYIRSKSSVESQREDIYNANQEEDTTPTAVGTETDTSYVGHWGDRGYNTTTNINGIIYRNYKQGATAYGSKPFSEGDMTHSGCGPTSTAILLSGYGKDTGPWDLASWIMDEYRAGRLTRTDGSPVLIAALKKEGIDVTSANVGDVGNQKAVEDIKNTLKDGKPILLGNDYTEGRTGHWVCGIGLTNNDKDIIISDPNTYEMEPIIKNLEEWVSKYMQGATYIMPVSRPTGVNLELIKQRHEIVGFKSGLKVVMPENGTIEKIGDVNEENKNSNTNSNTDGNNSNNTNNGTNNSNNANNTNNSNNANNTNTSTDEETEEKTTNYDERVKKASEYFTTNGKYIIVKFKTGNGVNNWKMRIEGADFNDDLTKGQELNKGDDIGKTTTDNMKVILYDDKGAVVDDVEDYFKLPKRRAASSDDFEKLLFIPYEGGGTDTNGPDQVGPKWTNKQGNEEFGVGICQWTVVGDSDYLSGFLKGIYEKDSGFCSVLQPFLNYNAAQYLEHFEDLKEAFADMAQIDKEYLLQLEMEYAVEEKSNVVKQFGYAWLLDRPGAVIGTAFSLINYGPANFTDGMEAKGITEGMSDEEIIMRICAFEANMNGTAGQVYKDRSESQARVAIDILEGKVDAEKFVRKGATGSYAKYANGANPGYLNGY